MRLEHAIAWWTRNLTVNPEELEDSWDGEVRPVRLALRITSQCLNVHPSLECATTNLFNQLSAHHSVVTMQPRVVVQRYQTQLRAVADVTYKSTLLKVPSLQKTLQTAYTAITNVMSRVSAFVNEWVRYQVLWDLRVEHVGERLETDLDKWIRTLAEIRDTRRRLDDASSTGMNAFPVHVDTTDVLHKVSAKYDYWQRELQQRFVVVLGEFS